ncbi:hypothetical protein JZ751_005980 [Albula glossodonta]|uniref:Uncharacterized protein n=1 Tax=Albula glossodonta TaxID=121402 RepID=A0A8T2P0Z4_9TELE|nr:hypothetical protein JZ751_005980 [Albula glossodonta]
MEKRCLILPLWDEGRVCIQTCANRALMRQATQSAAMFAREDNWHKNISVLASPKVLHCWSGPLETSHNHQHLQGGVPESCMFLGE